MGCQHSSKGNNTSSKGNNRSSKGQHNTSHLSLSLPGFRSRHESVKYDSFINWNGDDMRQRSLSAEDRQNIKELWDHIIKKDLGKKMTEAMYNYLVDNFPDTHSRLLLLVQDMATNQIEESSYSVAFSLSVADKSKTLPLQLDPSFLHMKDILKTIDCYIEHIENEDTLAGLTIELISVHKSQNVSKHHYRAIIDSVDAGLFKVVGAKVYNHGKRESFRKFLLLIYRHFVIQTGAPKASIDGWDQQQRRLHIRRFGSSVSGTTTFITDQDQ